MTPLTPRPRSRAALFWLMAAGLGLMACGILVMAGAFKADPWVDLILVLSGAILSLLALGLLIREAVGRLRLGEPVVSISAEPLRLGQAFTVRYQQAFGRPVALTRLRAQLVFRETQLVSDESLHDETDQQVMQEAHRPYPSEPRMDVDEEFGFAIPVDGTPTFVHERFKRHEVWRTAEERTKLEWLLQVFLQEVGKQAAFEAEYAVTVLPERVG